MKILKLLDGKVKFKLGKKSIEISKKIPAIILVAVIVVAAFTYSRFSGDKKTDSELATAQVTRGDIVSVIEGTGIIEAINQYEVTSLAKGDIIADYFEEGDYVEKDQLLYEMDSSSVTSSIQKAQSSYEKAQMSYDQANDDVANLNIKADISGVITSLNIKKGDQVGNNAVVAEIVDRDTMLLKIPFNTNDAKNLWAGQSATINLESSFTTVSGKVERIATGSTINSYGVSVTNVEIAVSNPGSIMPGDKATAVVGDYACNDAGTFEYKNESTIVAEVSGKVASLNYKEGDKISKGAVIARLESDSVTTSARSNRLSLSDAQQSLKDAQDALDDYRITAPIAGKIIEKNIKAGEKLDQNSSSTMAIIADLSSLVFEMSIDELDIGKIEVGQEVEIVADAIEDKTFTGTVTSISIVGTSAQGVTSYPVKVTIEDGEQSGLIPGMNVTGSVIVESVENVLRVPVSAVRRGNFVIVKDDGTVDKNSNNDRANTDDKGAKLDDMPDGEVPPMTDVEQPRGDMPKGDKISSALDLFITKAFAQDSDEQQKQADRLENMKNQLDVPSGYTVVSVETGLSNDTFIEIKSGLSEGQTVLLPDTTTSTQQGMMGMMGSMHSGMGGGMPSGGGMPGGGGMPSGGGMPGGGAPGGRN